MIGAIPICMNCNNYNFIDKSKMSCKAFNDEIPDIIITGENDHSKPLPDQKNDIIFEPIKK